MAGQLRVDEITDEAGTGSPSFPVGNVGIGTSSPKSDDGGNKLEISNNANTVVTLTATNDTTPLFNFRSNAVDRLSIQSSSNFGANFLVRSNQDMRFGTNNTERMRIDSSGNVGIGTSSPSAKLHTTAVSQVSGSSGVIERIRNNYYIGFLSRNISANTAVFKVGPFAPVNAGASAATVRVTISGVKSGFDFFSSIFEFTILRTGQSALAVTQQRALGRGGLSTSVSGNDVIFTLGFSSYSGAMMTIEVMASHGSPGQEGTTLLSFL